MKEGEIPTELALLKKASQGNVHFVGEMSIDCAERRELELIGRTVTRQAFSHVRLNMGWSRGP